MPLELVMISRRPLSVDLQREFGEAMNPPMIVRETRSGGAVEFTELDGTPALTVLRSKAIQETDEIERLLPDLPVSGENGYWTEGIVPAHARDRGAVVFFALEAACEGIGIMKGHSL